VIYLFGSAYHISASSVAVIEKLLENFSQNFENIWGATESTINFHYTSCHILDACIDDSFISPFAYSCFPFESYMSSIMRSMHGTVGSLKQSARNLYIKIQGNALSPKYLPPSKKFKFTDESKDTQYVCNTYAYDEVHQKFYFITAVSDSSEKMTGNEIIVKPFFENIPSEFNNTFVFVKKLNNEVVIDLGNCIHCVKVKNFISKTIKFTLM